MLTQVCQYLRNWFDKKQPKVIGRMRVVDGTISPPPSFLQEGQYFRIKGSVFNDGVYEWPVTTLQDENEFWGEIWAMAVPAVVVALSNEIDEWNAANKSTLDSPYQSESFGGYSYTKASGQHGNGEVGGAYSWQDHFKSQLSHWRKL